MKPLIEQSDWSETLKYGINVDKQKSRLVCKAWFTMMLAPV